MSIIEVSHLSKYYAGKRAIDQVNFSINEGEIIGLLGLNGAGKSTILKMIGCYLLPSTGTVRVAGFSSEADPQEIRRRIGYLPDTPPLYDEMTVVAYLRYVAALKDVQQSNIDAYVQDAMSKTNLTDVSHMRMGELSHGFRQRVGIAQALVHKPKLLILDEPINGLDPVQIVEMRDLIVSLKGQHTVILSSHILSEITKTCDRILIIDRGRLVAEGSEDELAGRMTKAMRLACEIKGSGDKALGVVRGVAGVERAQLVSDGAPIAKLTIETGADVRAEISQALVGAGLGLLSLHKTEAGLEALFMQLVRAGGRGDTSGDAHE